MGLLRSDVARQRTCFPDLNGFPTAPGHDRRLNSFWSTGMTRRSSRSQVGARVRLDQVLLTSALALLLTTLPVSIDTSGPALDWHSALARGGGGGGGNGAGGGAGQ